MKPSETMTEALATMRGISTKGDLRLLVSNAMLALARKEISATDFLALAKGLDSISQSMQTEVNIAKTRLLMLKEGGQIVQGKGDTKLGQLRVGHEV